MRRILFGRCCLAFPALSALLWVTGTAAIATPFYVAPDGTDTNTGASWETALASVSNAVAKAAAGGVIYIKAGTYAIVAPVDIINNPGLTLSGGYAGSGSPGPTAGTPSVITRSLTITNRIFTCNNATVTLEGLTVSNGLFNAATSAGILLTNNCNVVISNCVIRNNRSGSGRGIGIGAYGGSLAIYNSSLVDNRCTTYNSAGGALYAVNVNPLIVRSSVVASNSVNGYANSSLIGHGGAFFISGCTATMENSDFIANYSSGTGPQYGGAIHAAGTGSLSISNCTFDANYISGSTTRRGGVIYITGAHTGVIADSLFRNSSLALGSTEDLYLDSSQPVVIRNTVMGSGGATGILKLNSGGLTVTNCMIHSQGSNAMQVVTGSVAVANSTFANNVGMGVLNGVGTVALVNSIVWGNTGGGTSVTGSGTITATYSNLQDPLGGTGNQSSDPLFTAGFYLAAGSPAIDTGSATAAALGLETRTTQTNGIPDDGQVDLGYHATAGLSAMAQSNLVLYVDNGTGDNGDDGWTPSTALANLTEAFARAVDGSTIHIAPGTYSAATGESMPMQPLSLNLKLVGSNPETTILNGGSNAQIFAAVSIGMLHLEGLTFTNGYLASGDGAGLYLRNTQTTMTNCVVRGNRGMNPIRGIGISAYGGSLLVTDSEIANNWCTQYDSHGAGIYANEVLLTVRSSVVASNTVVGYANGGKQGYGGGLAMVGGHAVIDGSSFTDNATKNTGPQYGGALYASGTGTLLVTNSVFTGNYAAGSVNSTGGVFFITGARTSLITDSFFGNNSKQLVGAEDFYINSSMPTVFRHTELFQGGYRGIYKLGAGALTLTNTLVHTYAGHGVHVATGTVMIANSTVAGGASWGLYNEAGTITLIDTVVWGNASGGQTTTGAGSISAAYSDLQNPLAGSGNQSADPLFELGYYLSSGSPCINGGSQLASALGLGTRTTQTDGTTDGGQVDIGFHYSDGVGGNAASNLTLYVNASAGDNANDGWTEGNALKNIHAALDRVTPGGTIHIAAGDYTAANGEVYPLQPVKFNLTLIGTNRTSTVLDAGGAARVLQADSVGNLNLRLEGLTLANGLAVSGAGLYLVNCGTVMSNCVVRGSRSSAGGYGVGIYASGASLQMHDTDLVDNLDSQVNDTYGGAVAGINLELTMRGCNIITNSAAAGAGGGGANSAGGGGLYVSGGNAWLEDCLFLGNYAGAGISVGGAIHALGAAALTLTNCVFVGNHIRTDTTPEGVVYLAGSASMRLLDCRIEANTNAVGKNADDLFIPSSGSVSLWNTILAGGSGCGIRKTGSGSLSMTNTLVHGQPGHGVWVAAGNVNMDNVTIAGNGGWGVTNSSGTVSLLNSIAWGNTTGGVSGASATYSDIQGGLAGDGNINSDPSFTDPGIHDYTLRSASPCLNKGTNNDWMATGVDLAGSKRLAGSAVDMGAYESQASLGTLLLVY